MKGITVLKKLKRIKNVEIILTHDLERLSRFNVAVVRLYDAMPRPFGINVRMDLHSIHSEDVTTISFTIRRPDLNRSGKSFRGDFSPELFLDFIRTSVEL